MDEKEFPTKILINQEGTETLNWLVKELQVENIPSALKLIIAFTKKLQEMKNEGYQVVIHLDKGEEHREINL